MMLEHQSTMDDILYSSAFMLVLSKEIGKDWLDLGRFLSVGDSALDVIDHEEKNLGEKVYRMLCLWRNQQKFPSLNALASGLKLTKRVDLIFMIIENTKMCETLKKFYVKSYGKMDEVVHYVKNQARIELLNKLIEVTKVNEVGRDNVSALQQNLFLQKQTTNEPIKLDEVFLKEQSLLLISGIIGIGKTWLLRMCLLDWASGFLWKNVELVLYLECRKLNQYQSISNIKDLLNVFYVDIFQEFDVCEHFSILFVIDGLDEFAYLDELINHNPLNPSKQPIVNALAEALNTQKHKCVVTGRVGAIWQYKDKLTECVDKLNIQIMGFNDQGINEYIKNFCNKKETIKGVLKESHNCKAMASVPFYLSAMCLVIDLSDSYSFYTMTELYCCIFLYFFQKHICKSNETVHRMMQSESNKQHILRVCKVAWELFNQGKVILSQDEMKGVVNDFDEVEHELLGFIERVESQLGCQYQFAHLSLVEFCASVYAHIYMSPEEVISNKKLHSILPTICGLANKNESCFVRLLANLKTLKEESNSMLVKIGRSFVNFFTFNKEGSSLIHAVFALVPKGNDSNSDDLSMFMECFFEAQASITAGLKRSFDEREWKVDIRDVKTAREVSHEKYFMEKFIDSGFKLDEMHVCKKILSEDEEKLVILCSTNVRRVHLFHPVKIDRWSPKYKIENLRVGISHTLVSKKEFEDFVLPWIRLAEELILELHDDTNFIEDICEWLHDSVFKLLLINYRGKEFYNIEEFKIRNTKSCLIC